jgi:protein translocase SecG subunit
MKLILQSINIVVSLALVALILIQGKGAGLGSAWGGGGEFFQTRRGVEKLTLQLTVVLIIVFFVVSLISFFVK